MSRSRDEICTKTLLNGFNKTPTKSDYSQWYLRFWFSKTTEIHSSQWLRFFAVFCSLDPQAYHRWPSGCPAPSPGGFSRWEKKRLDMLQKSLQQKLTWFFFTTLDPSRKKVAQVNWATYIYADATDQVILSSHLSIEYTWRSVYGFPSMFAKVMFRSQCF